MVGDYLGRRRSAAGFSGFARRHAGDALRIESVRMLVDDVPATSVRSGQPCQLRIEYVLKEARRGPVSCSILLFANGEKLANLWTDCDPGYSPSAGAAPRRGVLICDIPKWPFRRHSFRVDVFSHFGDEVQDWIEEAMFFESYDGDYYQSGIIPNPNQGIVFIDHRWRAEAGTDTAASQFPQPA